MLPDILPSPQQKYMQQGVHMVLTFVLQLLESLMEVVLVVSLMDALLVSLSQKLICKETWIGGNLRL